MENIPVCLDIFIYLHSFDPRKGYCPHDRIIVQFPTATKAFVFSSVQKGSLQSTAKVKKHRTILPLSHMPSWHIEGTPFY
jgi:hypothetical protein